MLRRLAVLLTSVALATGVSPAVHADEPTGTARVTLTDAPGDPVAGGLVLLPVGGTWESAYRASGEATHDFVVPPGRYAVVGLSPWGGLRCAGVTPCSVWTLAQDQGVVTGVVDVVAGELSQFTLSAPPAASITGTRAMTLTLSEPMRELETYLTGTAEFGRPSVQWRRDGMDIPGATGSTYVPVAEDVGSRLSARLTYHPFAVSFLSHTYGADASPVTVDGPIVGPPGDPLRTRTRATLLPKRVPRTEHAWTHLRVEADEQVVGEVKVVMGRFRRTVQLVAGEQWVELPRRAPGRYAVTIRFLGSSAFGPSLVRRTLVVTRG